MAFAKMFSRRRFLFRKVRKDSRRRKRTCGLFAGTEKEFVLVSVVGQESRRYSFAPNDDGLESAVKVHSEFIRLIKC